MTGTAVPSAVAGKDAVSREQMEKLYRAAQCTGQLSFAAVVEAAVARLSSRPPIIGWHWQAVIRGEVVNSGVIWSEDQPQMTDTVPGVTFEYRPLYGDPVLPPATAELVAVAGKILGLLKGEHTSVSALEMWALEEALKPFNEESEG